MTRTKGRQRAWCRLRSRLDNPGWPWLLLVAAIALVTTCAPRSGLNRPDVVLVIIDTLRADHLPIYGYTRNTSPNLSAIAAHGLVFERAFSHSGWTLPSIGSLLTGLYPSENGLTSNSKGGPRFGRLRAGVTTLADVLSSRGYRTAAFVNNLFLAPGFGLQRGFDVYDYRASSNQDIRSAEDTVDAALQWLRSDTRPAFVLVHFMEPHLDYDPPKATRGRFAPGVLPVNVPFRGGGLIGRASAPRPSPDQLAAIEALYDEEVLAADMALGRLYRELMDRTTGRRRWFWVTSDHGEEFWDHHSFEHGHQLFGELIHVPLIAVGPATPATRIQAPVQHVDVFRTLVELAGGQVPPGSRGVNLLDAAATADAFEKPRPIVSEDTLYGPRRIALTLGSQRLVVTLPDQTVNLYSLNGDGQGDRLVQEPDAATRRALLEELRVTRGSFAMPQLSWTPAELDPKDVQRLRSLGYIR